MKKLVNIKELKESYDSEYQKEYQKFCEMQWSFDLETDWFVEGLNEKNKWLDVDAIQYSVGYSQGDYAYFTGRVMLERFLDEFDGENEYFVLREAMKLRDCGEVMQIRNSPRWGSNADFDEIEWCAAEDGYYDPDDVVKSYAGYRSVLEGMNYHEYYNICIEMMDNLHTWVKEVCEGLFRDLYYEIRDEIEHQMSEESFEEWAESMGEEFEVEVDDDKCGDDNCLEDGRMAA